jgi:hypothetical protein
MKDEHHDKLQPLEDVADFAKITAWLDAKPRIEARQPRFDYFR